MTVATINDVHGRQLTASIDARTGEVMLSRPCGKPGKVERVIQAQRVDVRRFARDLLALVGEHDQ